MRWTVRPGDGHTVGAVLARAGSDADAVKDGRVFVGPRRVRREDEAVTAGEVVHVAAPRALEDRTATLLLRAADFVAADKPAGIPTIPDHAGAAHSLIAAVARALGVETSRLHPTSRLDRDVSGVVVFTRTAEAAQRLARARGEGAYERRYVALAARAPQAPAGTWDAAIGRARDPRLRMVGGRDPIDARTRYRVVAVAPRGEAMLAVAPQTGRTHQIRVHAAHAGAPLLGDRSYGGPPRVTLPTGRVLEPGRVALHAARIVVPGEDGAPVVVTSAIPAELESLWSALGGDAAAWEVATSCALS
ncbi:MAG TPA: RluA family pseudouridine synthase [Polyangiaceae bacterium]|jgi:23S rRNA-/tRNA-specific pseudouridylate synthase